MNTFNDYYNMINFFNDRTNKHISLVQNYIFKIINIGDERIDNTILKNEVINGHDKSKWEEPEHTPYLFLTWKKHQENIGNSYDISNNIKRSIQRATFHHVKYNLHHPEYWDDNSTIDNINGNDRDKPSEKMTDATLMPLSYIAIMVADWLAMSEEFSTNPYDWAKNNINVRWRFTTEQEKLIYDLLKKLYII